MSDEGWGSTNTEDLPLPGDSTLDELDRLNEELAASTAAIKKAARGKKGW